ncbi:cytochrome ubiquinol oxidase subunit I [Flavobacteriaceae bacterium]|nr:cytochrome ubiquinol oxidase subunit I [Flavobacteriaceae bacterium]
MEIFNSVELLSRIQFAFTVSFHIIWPTINIGLGLFLLILEASWLKTKKIEYLNLYKFWVKIFALAFGIGVVTGIPLSYQFGTNFSIFSNMAGPIIGPLLGIEVMTAFFLEAAFIGVMIFGWSKVPKSVHLFATIFVVLGTHNSAFWVIAANSWMHTPQGFEIIDGIIHAKSWTEIILNPSFPYRIAHMLTASYISVSLLIAGISSYFLIKKTSIETAKKGLSISLLVLTFLAPLQIFLGDLHGLNTKEYQPAKIAAMEGLWKTQKGAPLILFAIPDEENEKNKYEIKIPKLASFILTHDFDGEVKGLNEFKKEERPPILPVFFAFRIMVGLGILFLLIAFTSIILRFRKKLCSSHIFHKLCMICTPLGLFATVSGWWVTEIGRQPWLIHGILKTKDALSPVKPEVISISLLSFIFVYCLLAISFLYYASRLVKKGYDFEKNEEWLKIATHTTHLTTKNSKND